MLHATERCESGDVIHDGPLGSDQKGQMENSLYDFHLTLSLQRSCANVASRSRCTDIIIAIVVIICWNRLVHPVTLLQN